MTTRGLLLILCLLASMPALAQTPLVTITTDADVVDTIFSPRADRMATILGEDRIAIWSVPAGTLAGDVRLPQRLTSLAFVEGDQIVVALADGGIEVRSLTSGAVIRRMDAGTAQRILVLSADGRLLASSGEEHIRLWDASGTLLHTFGHEFGTVGSLAFSPDGKLLVSAGYDTNVHVWDVSTGQRKASVADSLLATFVVTFTPDGTNLVIGGANGAVEIVDARTASSVRRFRPEKYAVMDLRLSEDGRSAGAAYLNVDSLVSPAPVAVWDLASGRAVRRVTPGARAALGGFAPDGRLLYATAAGRQVTVWALPGASRSFTPAR